MVGRPKVRAERLDEGSIVNAALPHVRRRAAVAVPTEVEDLGPIPVDVGQDR
jgi:hypothetical protein